MTDLEKFLTEALHSTETSGGWWGHPECEEFGRVLAPKLRLFIKELQVDAWNRGFDDAEKDILGHVDNNWQNTCIPNPYEVEDE